METVRRRPGIASLTAGLIAYVVIIILSPAGDLVVPFVGGIAAAGLAGATYFVLRRMGVHTN
jgi:hypothetical protein